MKRVSYLGPFDAIDVAVDGGFVRIEQGESAELPDDLAKSLLEQTDHFAAAKSTKTETK